jgi:TP901 family phage tail tape measure protein
MARTGNKFALSGRLGLNATNFKKGLSGAGRKYDNFQRNIRDKNHMIGRSFNNLNRKINTGFKRAAFVGLGSLTLGLGIAAREFVNFDQAIVSAGAKFKSLEPITKDTETLLRKTARSVGETTHFTATQAAEGLNFYAKAGFKAVEAMSVLANTADLATVAEMDLNRTADISSDLLSSLGLNSQNAAIKIKNLGMMNRALGLSVNMANVNLEDMFETLKLAGPIASDIGGTTNEIIAMTAALGGAGIKGSLASTALRNMYGKNWRINKRTYKGSKGRCIL